jgi:hypothetical protein
MGLLSHSLLADNFRLMALDSPRVRVGPTLDLLRRLISLPFWRSGQTETRRDLLILASTVIVKTLTSGHAVAPNYEGESMPIRDEDGHRAMQAAGKAWPSRPAARKREGSGHR